MINILGQMYSGVFLMHSYLNLTNSSIIKLIMSYTAYFYKDELYKTLFRLF